MSAVLPCHLPKARPPPPLTPSQCVNLNWRVVWADDVAARSTLLFCFHRAQAECSSRDERCRAETVLCRRKFSRCQTLEKRRLHFAPNFVAQMKQIREAGTSRSRQTNKHLNQNFLLHFIFILKSSWYTSSLLHRLRLCLFFSPWIGVIRISPRLEFGSS